MGCREEIVVPRGLYEVIPHGLFEQREYRPTVGMLIGMNGGILMVRSAHADGKGLRRWWTLPQEGIIETDGTLAGAVGRGMKEELGHVPSDATFFSARILGEMWNKVPKARTKNGGRTKLIVFVGLRAEPFEIRLNHENLDYRIVTSFNELDKAMEQVAEHRVYKYMCTCEAIVRACACGLLSWKLPKGLRHSMRTL